MMRHEILSLESSRDRALKLLQQETANKEWLAQDLRETDGIFRYYRYNVDENSSITKPVVLELNQLNYADGKIVRNTHIAIITSLLGVSDNGQSSDLEITYGVDLVGKSIRASQSQNVGRLEGEKQHPELLRMYSEYGIDRANEDEQWHALERTLNVQY